MEDPAGEKEFRGSLNKVKIEVKNEIKVEHVGLNVLLPVSVTERMAGLISWHNVPAAPVSIDRLTVAAKYGGSPQSLCPKIDRKKHSHMHHFIFPGLDTNPNAPREPGEPGLLYRTTNDVPWGEQVVKLFVRFNKNDYRYLGDYVSASTTPLRRSEYQELSLQVFVISSSSLVA